MTSSLIVSNILQNLGAFHKCFCFQASVSDSVRKRMLKERIVPKAEEYWFMTEHPHLRAAAAELFLNLLYCDEFFELTVKVMN